MKTPSPLFTDKARLLFKEFDHYTPNGNSIYTYIFERLERLDTYNDINNHTFKPYGYYNSVKMFGQNENIEPNNIYTIEYTRKNKNSWDFKLLNII